MYCSERIVERWAGSGFLVQASSKQSSTDRAQSAVCCCYLLPAAICRREEKHHSRSGRSIFVAITHSQLSVSSRQDARRLTLGNWSSSGCGCSYRVVLGYEHDERTDGADGARRPRLGPVLVCRVIGVLRVQPPAGTAKTAVVVVVGKQGTQARPALIQRSLHESIFGGRRTGGCDSIPCRCPASHSGRRRSKCCWTCCRTSAKVDAILAASWPHCEKDGHDHVLSPHWRAHPGNGAACDVESDLCTHWLLGTVDHTRRAVHSRPENQGASGVHGPAGCGDRLAQQARRHAAGARPSGKGGDPTREEDHQGVQGVARCYCAAW